MLISSVGPEVRPVTLASLLRRRSAERPGKVAFTFLADGEAEGGSARLTYSDLDRRARAIAGSLHESLAPGDRALLLYPPGLDFIAAFFGCLYAGVIAVPAYPPRLNDRSQGRLRAIARDAEPRAALTTEALFAAASRIPELAAVRWIPTDALEGSDIELPDPDPESVAFLQYTSGSTATPKGVMVTHANLLHNERMIGEAFRQDEETVVVGWLPLYHDMGLIGNVLQPLWAGGTCVLMSPVAFLQKPLRWLEAIHRHRGTTSGGPNFAYELCVRRIGEEQKAGLDLSSWRVAYNGAEPVRAETLERFAEAFAPCGFRREAFYPCYGLAEATLFVSGGEPGAVPRVARVDAAALEEKEARPVATDTGARRLVSCGRAWAGQRIVVADPETGAERSPGRIGEIWIAGPSVARGYWRNPEATAHDFQARLGTGEGPFLRTGDLGFLRDGELYVTGRLKDLIILRGRNHYPQDIELTAERSHPDLRPGSGAAFSVEVAGEERLVLVQEVERRRREAFEELVEAVRDAVAREHEVQVHEVVLVRVGTVPKTSSGKGQRRACRSLYLAGELAVVGRSAVASDLSTEREAIALTREALLVLEPAERRTVLERFLRERAAASVGVPAAVVDPRKPLTALGLDSLAAVELKAAVETALGLPLPLADLLEGAGTAELAEALLPGLAESRSDLPVLRAGGAEAGLQPLSFGQKALWFLDRLAPEGGAYNVAVAAHARGLRPDVLRRALIALALRHPVLRSVFPVVDDEPTRQVMDQAEIDFTVEDATGWSEARLSERLAEVAYRPFDLGRGPLLRVRAFDRGNEEHALLLAVHHIAVDFASLAVVARDLGALVREEAGGAPAELAPLPFGVSDFVRWQEEMLASSRGGQLWSWWRDALDGLPDLDLPTDRPRPPVQTWRGGARTLELPADLANAVRSLAAAQGATLFMPLLAAFQTQLARYSGQEDLAVGSPSAARAPELSGVVGYFVNPVALRADLSGEPSFTALLGRTRRTVLDGLERADFPFALLAERLRPARDPARPPLFQVLFLLQRTRPGDEPGIATFALGEAGGRLDLGGVELESLRLEERRAQLDLTLRVAEEADGRLRASLEFNADLFDGATAERMLGHFQTLLAGAVEHPDRPVTRLEMLTPAEREQALVTWNAGSGAEYRRDVLLHGLFEEQAARTPEAEALVAGAERLTYAELNHRATELAHRLRALGVGPEVRVGVRMGRSADLVVSLLGVLKAGGAYVPLDPNYPRERLDLMLADSGARVVIDPPFLRQGTDRWAVGSGLPPLPPSDTHPGNLAYLIYTSGSTGRPKAVAIEHRSAALLAQWARGVFGPDELAGALASTSIAFDLSVFEIFVPLAWGGRVILAENALELPRLRAENITLINTVPSAMAELVRSNGVPASVRTANLAGEPIPPSLAEAIHALPGGVRLFNLYGPSEDTTYSTWTRIAPGADVTIGRPIDRTQAYVLDPHLEPVPAGVPGELLLGGEGLARGYLGRPELTAERFIPNPFGEPGTRLYRTGDLVRRRADGALDFLGRIDHQVKIRGFRVELGEVEEALARHPAVRDVAVLALPEPGGGRRLAAYLVPQAGETLEPAALRVFLKERLPDAFVPTGWRVLEALPLSPNRKVDRKALARLAPETRGSSVRPRTPVERELAALMAEALGVESVGVHDDFFALGGHSLLATRVVSRASRTFGVDLPVSALFQAPTAAALAERISGAAGAAIAPPVMPVLRPHEGREDLPLSFGQRRLWFLDRLQPGGAAYNMPGAAELDGALYAAALARALSEVVRRHETLRTRFIARGGEPVQVVDPPAGLAPVVIDLSGLPDEIREDMAEALSRDEAARPFDLARGPLLRATLLRLAPERHRLLLTLHHSVADGWSLGLLLDELAALYGAFAAGRPSPLDELPVHYADFVVWQHGWLTGEVLDRQLAWWREQLDGAPATLDLPADRPRTGARTQRGAVVWSSIPPVLAGGVRGLARQRGATPFMVLLAAFQSFLVRLTRQDDLLVGSVVAGRSRPETEGLIGFFANTLVLRGELTGDPTFSEALERVRARTLGAWAHQDLPVERLVEELQPGRELGLSPLFQVLFLLQGAPAGLELPGLTVRHLPVTSGAAKLDLTLELTEQDGGFAAAWELSRDLFEESTVERFAGWLTALLAGAVADPEQRLSALPLSGAAELAEILARREENRRARESAREAAGREVHRGGGTPRNPVEELLAAIWEEVLGVERVGVHDDFFARGGHSLLGTRVISRIADTLQVDLPLSVLFEQPTIARLAGRVAELSGRVTDASPLVPRLDRSDLPLSFAQERLWFLDRIQPGAAYNIPLAVHLRGPLDAGRLGAAFGAVVARHEALRTVFPDRDGEPEQRILPPAATSAWPLPLVDLSGLPRPAAEAQGALLGEEEAARAFSLEEGPLLRTTLLRLAPHEHLLLLDMHHIVSDGWSLGILLGDLAAFYGGAPGQLPALPVQYGDFAVWQKEWLHGRELERQMGYWRRQLAGAPAVLDLPADRPRPLIASLRGAQSPVTVPSGLTARLGALARQQGVTPFMLLLAAWQTLLGGWTQQEDLTVGTPIAGRNRSEIENLVGFFVNTLVLRGDLAEDPAFPDLLARTRRTALAAFEHQDLPFEKLVDELRPERDMSRQPLFQVLFVLQNAPLGALELPGGLTLDPVPLGSTVAKFDLTLSLTERQGELAGMLEYSTDLFDATTVARLAARFGVLLAAIEADPERRLSELPALGEAERHQLLVEWADGQPEPEGLCLHEVIEAEVDRSPEAPALELGEIRWSYREMDLRANRLAWHLRELGVGPEVRVALSMERGVEMIVGMLGVLKAGGAYVPLDLAHPQERLQFLLADSGARVLLTQERLLDRWPESGIRIVCVDRDEEEIARRPDVRPASGVTVQNPAYVIYTSGSTGTPKGVVISHGAVVAYTRIGSLVYASGPGDRALQLTSISFDASVEEIFCVLTRGATLVVRAEAHEGITELLARCRAQRITLLQMTTAYWHQLASVMDAEALTLPPELRVVFIGGEKMLAQRLVSWWRRVPPGVRFINAYGPTEATVAITLCTFPGRVPVDENLREVPLGRPVSYARTYVLDRRLRPVPVGAAGELCVGGISLSRGYLGRPGLTAERFIPDPYSGLPGERLYRTGDLVRLRPDSLLEFAGRTDHQVKIRGYRVELGEIESTLATHPGVGEVVVLTREDAPGEVRLAAFAASKGEAAPTATELRSFLTERLPAYMVPPSIQVLPVLPVTAHGKVDRGALARLAPQAPRQRAAFAAPRNELEAEIAAVWRDVFGLAGDAEALGIHDNFFDAGGSSLSLVKLHSRLQKALDRDFPLIELFRHPTIAALAASLGTAAPARPSLDQARARTDARRESMRQLQQLRDQRRSRRPGR